MYNHSISALKYHVVITFYLQTNNGLNIKNFSCVTYIKIFKDISLTS